MADVIPIIKGKRVAILVEQEFEDGEVIFLSEKLRASSAAVVFVAPSAPTQYRGKHGHIVTSDVAAGRGAHASTFDAVVIPGGYAADRMRMRHAMVDLVREAVEAGKPVAAICYGPQLLISAKAVRDKMITCWPTIAIDIKNAGGLYMDKPVVEDGNLITSRKSDDLAAFSDAIIRALSRVPNASNYEVSP